VVEEGVAEGVVSPVPEGVAEEVEGAEVVAVEATPIPEVAVEAAEAVHKNHIVPHYSSCQVHNGHSGYSFHQKRNKGRLR
jgi:hypothetical protein